MLCVFMVEGMSVGVNVMLSLMSVISPPPDLCGLSARNGGPFLPPSGQFLRLLYGGPSQVGFFSYYIGGHLRSVT